jgi:hypothetical protein
MIACLRSVATRPLCDLPAGLASAFDSEPDCFFLGERDSSLLLPRCCFFESIAK